MSLSSNMKKKLVDFMNRISLGRYSEMNHLEFQREVRKRKRQKAGAIAARDRREELTSSNS